MYKQAIELGTEFLAGRAVSALSTDKGVSIAYGSETIDGNALILALGVAASVNLPGERELLGRGVSYCATCDGMLYRGRRIIVCAYTHEADKEADFLRSIGCDVVATKSKNVKIIGDKRVTAAEIDDEHVSADAVFILRPTIAPNNLISGLATENGAITINADCSTNLPNVYAAGDCTGAPHQIAKAVGQGQIAALNIVKGK